MAIDGTSSDLERKLSNEALALSDNLECCILSCLRGSDSDDSSPFEAIDDGDWVDTI